MSEQNEVALTQLSKTLNMDYCEILTILSMMESQGMCHLSLGIYHCSKIPSQYMPFGTGFPGTPWTCPLCNQIVTDIKKLKFDFIYTKHERQR